MKRNVKRQAGEGVVSPRRKAFSGACLFAGIIMWLFLSGCGQTALQQAKSAGLVSKQTAETAYLTIYTEHLLGHVDAETVEQARILYARWAVAQAAYVAALRLWETGQPPADLEALKAQIVALAAELHAVAVTAEARPTSQPSS